MNLFFQKNHWFIIPFLTLLLSFNTYADSPLTSIEFWELSESKLVLKIGKKQGKKRLNKKGINFLLDSNQTTFDKIALVNAISWEYDSKIKNAPIFLKALEKFYLKNLKKYYPVLDAEDREDYNFEKKAYLQFSAKEKFELNDMESGDNLYFIYLYLLAMDNYTDVSFVNSELTNTWAFDEDSFTYVKTLITAQNLMLNTQLCDVGKVFNSAFFDFDNDCFIENSQVKNAVNVANNYLKIYLRNCDRIEYYVANFCMPNEIIATPRQLLWILHYPAFVYGNLVIYDAKNTKIEEHKINGDDFVEIKLTDYLSGSYKIKMTDSDNNKYVVNLKII